MKHCVVNHVPFTVIFTCLTTGKTKKVVYGTALLELEIKAEYAYISF